MERILPRWSDPLLGFVIKCSRSIAPCLNVLSWKVGVGIIPSLCVGFMLVQILQGWPDPLLFVCQIYGSGFCLAGLICSCILHQLLEISHTKFAQATTIVHWWFLRDFLLQLWFKQLPVIYNIFLNASCVPMFWNFSVCHLLVNVQHCHHFVEWPVMVIGQDHCVVQINHECIGVPPSNSLKCDLTITSLLSRFLA